MGAHSWRCPYCRAVFLYSGPPKNDPPRCGYGHPAVDMRETTGEAEAPYSVRSSEMAAKDRVQDGTEW